MTTINDNIARCREHLDNVAKLAQAAPDLLEHGSVYIQEDRVRVIICDSAKQPPYWITLAEKYRRANWQIDNSTSQLCWDGELDGVCLSIIPTVDPTGTGKTPLFADAQEAA